MNQKQSKKLHYVEKSKRLTKNREEIDAEHNGEEMEADKNREDKEGEEDETVTNSGEECLTEQSKKKRRTRGPTRMRSITLSSFLGPLVREHVPVLLDDWRRLDDKTKDTMWEEIQGRFNLTEDWQKSCVFRQMGCVWRASKSRVVSKLRSTKSMDTIRKLKPNNIHNDAAWINWVKSRTGHSFKVRSDQFRALRNNQIPHTTSRKGMVRLAHDLKKKASDPSKVTRSKIWIAGHTHADGRAVRPEFEETIEQIKSLDSEIESNSNGSIKEDAVSQILGKDKSGRVRGMGRGITASKLAFLQARDAHVQKIEARQAELVHEIADLKHIVRDLTAGKKDYGSNSDATDKSNFGPRCQLLEWYSDEEIVVADGEICSTEPTYKIGRIPIGPNAAAVVVKFASDKEAYVWRPTTTVTLIGQAVGTKIAWPFNKLILDNIDSPTVNKTAGSATNVLVDRIQILDWNFGDQVIAEGHMTSTDAKQLVNGIPLGPNAKIVKIDTVNNKEAYLWRPSEDMTVTGDALFHNIAWPITKVLMDNLQATVDELSESESDPKVPGRQEPSLQNGARAFASKGAGASCSKGAVPSTKVTQKSTSNSSNNSPPPV
ncbi:uncharacterized protein LOC112082141 [Eutrema salsugineum]|uniref:uncharacterized protein LOC112082141 n=1 Tax=Eutrema salsugineum TaxID=72664 RepID=UPI000CECFF2D|nr:uncharacterized protein LOC112082141 [Eutrema salsugineum]